MEEAKILRILDGTAELPPESPFQAIYEKKKSKFLNNNTEIQRTIDETLKLTLFSQCIISKSLI